MIRGSGAFSLKCHTIIILVIRTHSVNDSTKYFDTIFLEYPEKNNIMLLVMSLKRPILKCVCKSSHLIAQLKVSSYQ